MSRFALRLRGVHKRYGRRVALDGLDLDIPTGSLSGLVGPNGAGKTTTFAIATGAVKADEGTVDVLGEGPFDPVRHAGRVTVLPQDCELPPQGSPRAILRYLGALQGLRGAEVSREADRVLDLVQLADRADDRLRTLSHGMRRRLAVAQALLGDPKLVLLDEPTGGLDPALVVAMRELLRASKGQRTIVVSSHILADLEATCDHVAFLQAGRCVRSGSLDEVTGRGRWIHVRLDGEPSADAVAERLGGREHTLSGGELRVAVGDDETPAEANAAVLPRLVELGVLEVRLGAPLEEAFLEGEVPGARRA